MRQRDNLLEVCSADGKCSVQRLLIAGTTELHHVKCWHTIRTMLPCSWLDKRAAVLQGKDDVTGEPLIRRKDDTAETLRKRLASFSQQTTPVSCQQT